MASKFCCQLCCDDSNQVPIFSNWYSLESHLYQVHMNNSYPMQCDQCASKFQSLYNLQRHRQRIHSNFAHIPDQCLSLRNCPLQPRCEQSHLDSYEHLKNHLLTAHASLFRMTKKMRQSLTTPNIFSPVCSSQTKSTPKATPKPDFRSSKFKCPHRKCGASYNSKKLFKIHLRDHEMFLSEKCSRCQKPILEDNPEFYLEVDSSLGPICGCAKTRPFACEVAECSKVFQTAHNLRKHVSQCHGNVPTFVCDFCETHFSSERNLQEHVQVHFNPQSFPCNFCGDFFNQQTALSRHIATIHKGRRSHFCCVCGKSFSQSGNLQTHLKNVHKMKCEKCFGQFEADNRTQLEQHVKGCDGNLIFFMENDNTELEREVTITGA